MWENRLNLRNALVGKITLKSSCVKTRVTLALYEDFVHYARVEKSFYELVDSFIRFRIVILKCTNIEKKSIEENDPYRIKVLFINAFNVKFWYRFPELYIVAT
ncbi:uncharacterized protein EV154DRAFT_486309 [Mucor mucedo]|uniref:uncharacterized protein n=1 Tax=Mucor mucedo TaxID=29922 RepID=UPI00221E8004|nr:uncharacterized protein EV154DRAFT_486309 [Mucor mucedo]KAI7877555.1 hypothetical protein EV154DRAFT_486309 [Mucor mucedo]